MNMNTAPSHSFLKRNIFVAFGALLASSGTLVCCVLPAVMVALGAGASLGALTSSFPQLIWLSDHKALVFGVAFGALALSGLALWRARRLPCPADPVLAASCTKLRKFSWVLWFGAVGLVLVGSTFAFVLPYILY